MAYSAKEQQLTCKESQAPLNPQNGQPSTPFPLNKGGQGGCGKGDGKIRLRILVDRTSIEIFGNDGGIYMPIGVIPPDENRSLKVFGKGGGVKVKSLEVYELRSAWK